MPRKSFLKLFWCFFVFDVVIIVRSIPDSEFKEELPSKIQQKKMIDTGREIFGFLREVVTNEAQESEAAVQKDVEMMIQNAKKQLNLEEENFNLRTSCSSNNVNSRGFLDTVPQLVLDAGASLGGCAVSAYDHASIIAGRIRTDAEKLERKGQEIMDAFLECSRKGSWSMFSCYKKAVGANMGPMKEFVTDTVRAHSGAHTDFLTLRSNAAKCVQSQLEDFRSRLETMYASYKN